MPRVPRIPEVDLPRETVVPPPGAAHPTAPALAVAHEGVGRRMTPAVLAALLATAAKGPLDVHQLNAGPNLVERGRVTAVTDESFAEAANLLLHENPTFNLGDFDPKRGQKFSSWETQRHNENPPDMATIELGEEGKVGMVVVDTKWHDGNHPQYAGLLASKDGVTWEPLIAPMPMEGHSLHFFRVDNPETWKFVRLEMYPDGGIARLRVYQESPETLRELAPHNPKAEEPTGPLVVRHSEKITKAEKAPFIYPDLDRVVQPRRAKNQWDQEYLLTNINLGARVAAASNGRYSHPDNILKETAPENMGDGWEMARSRPQEKPRDGQPLADFYKEFYDTAHEWAEIVMARPDTNSTLQVDRVGLDFTYFNFNSPLFMEIEGAYLRPGQDSATATWVPVVSKQRVKDHRSGAVELPSAYAGPLTHLRVKVYPCGGVHRVHAYGKARGAF